jgi:methylated-DNA-[protein]-cysteine S-methyltransferase
MTFRENLSEEGMLFYQLIHVGREIIGLVWSSGGGKPMIERIFLPVSKRKMADQIRLCFPQVLNMPRRIPDDLDEMISGLYVGDPIRVDLSSLNWSGLSGFSVKVLKQASRIPRGRVLTYSRLAAKAGFPRAARAVGHVMAQNPFPLVIPCHRVIRAGGGLGKFGGGAEMKKRLLVKEGIPIDRKGRVPSSYID